MLDTITNRPKSKTTYVSLSSLCQRYGKDARCARMKLRKAGMKPTPDGVWEWPTDCEELSWVIVELLKK